MKTIRKQIRITPRQVAALEALATALNICGQRGTTFQALILRIADLAEAALPETAAALSLANCKRPGPFHHQS